MLAICPECQRPVKVVPCGFDATLRRQILKVARHTASDDDSGGRVCKGVGRVV